MVAPISVQQQREEVMDFITPFYHDYTVVLMKQPDNERQWRILLEPFTLLVWLCGGLSVLVLTAILACVIVISPLEGRILGHTECSCGLNGGECIVREPMDLKVVLLKSGKRYGKALGIGLWYLYGAILSQGDILLPI